MKNLSLSLVFLIIISFFVSCSESSSPSSDNLTLVAGLSKSVITNSVNPKDDYIQSEIDSIKVESIRILISNIKAKLADAERIVDAGPVVISISDTINKVEFAKADLPSAEMDKIKYEIHRFSTSELSNYQNHNTFKDFATNDRHTIIIKGMMKSTSGWEAFEYKTDIVGNLNFDFNPPIALKDNINTIIEFIFESETVFKESGAVINPLLPSNKNHIDNQIKLALKAKYMI